MQVCITVPIMFVIITENSITYAVYVYDILMSAKNTFSHGFQDLYS